MPVFSTVTDAVVIAADGGTGLRAVELDTGASITRQVEQQRPGDQPYRLWGLGSWLVVGWGEIWAVGLDTATEPRLLGEASYFVPAAEPAELWLIDRPDWRGDGGSATWTLVDHTGTRLHRVEAAAGSEVERGVPGGLALRGDDGALHRYDTVTGEIDDLVGGTDARILDVTRDRLLWCEADCGTLQVSDDRRTIQVDADEVTEFLDGWLSADGTRIAAHVAVEVADGGRDFELWIHDLSDEMLVDRVQVQLGEMHAAWTPNGDQLLYRMVAEGGPSTFGRYTASGFDTVDHDPLEGLRPARFLVGRADWHPEFFGHEVDRPSDSR
ncbi:MAG: hypothetical protein WEB03_11460 [Nitriliruptor sp.]|uniref:hypothetical protein n=1 Tax=Nitriliruptor sp. TaxID=2448056 RepID=UPI0034A09C83